MFLQGGATGRQKILEDKGFDLTANLVKRRDSRQHGVGNGHHRHHRKQRGIGQGCGVLDAVVFDKAARQIAAKVQILVQLTRHSCSLTARCNSA